MRIAAEPILVKRYARSRLYDAAEASYVSVDDLRRWKGEGIPIVVRGAETGEDIARVVLA